MEENIKKPLKWYMITIISGKEKLVVESLENKIVSDNLEDIISDFKIAYVPHLTPKGKITERNLFPGYIFIKMRMTNDAWFIVRNTLYVTGLVGSSGHRTKPTPISIIEMKKINDNIKRIKDEFSKLKDDLPFKVDDKVRVMSGVLVDEEGPVVQIFAERSVALVELIQFGRKTLTEINFSDLEVIK